ncbi:hypothetical protein QE152_g26970 [Popillia japonica]|uniref:DUF4145 domain-containing protein n=1 Tax=Popillia japonica TaxID=7064 RepID=A0AAW1JV87_POPJA
MMFKYIDKNYPEDVMAFLILKAMLGKTEELPGFDDTDMTEVLKRASVSGNLERDYEYIRRLRNLAEHFLLNDFI